MEDLWVKLYDREGPLGHKRPACMLLFVFLGGGFSIYCHSADEEGVPERLCSRAFLFIALRSAQHPQIPRFSRGTWPLPLPLSSYSALALFCATHAHTPYLLRLANLLSRVHKSRKYPAFRFQKTLPISFSSRSRHLIKFNR